MVAVGFVFNVLGEYSIHGLFMSGFTRERCFFGCTTTAHLISLIDKRASGKNVHTKKC